MLVPLALWVSIIVVLFVDLYSWARCDIRFGSQPFGFKSFSYATVRFSLRDH
jgi:hypothetical protein